MYRRAVTTAALVLVLVLPAGVTCGQISDCAPSAPATACCCGDAAGERPCCAGVVDTSIDPGCDCGPIDADGTRIAIARPGDGDDRLASALSNTRTGHDAAGAGPVGHRHDQPGLVHPPGPPPGLASCVLRL